ncbi:MAG: HlyD family secretion protein [Acetobacteraceae bacterium]
MSQALTARDVPAQDVTQDTDRPAAPRRSRLLRSRLLRPLLMLGGIAAVVVGALYFWLSGGRIIAIDNAYIHASKLVLATDVSSIIAEVPVREGQAVRAGDVLFRLDDRQFRIALRSAQSDLAQTALQLEAMKRDYDRMLRDVAAKQAQVAADQARFDRTNGLVNRGDVSRQSFDDARFQLAADQQAVQSTQAAAQAQLARLGGNATADIKTLPAYLKAQAVVDEAQRQLDHTVVRAPMDGVVTGVDAAQPGLYLAASSAAFGLVATANAWVEANPKETDLTWLRPGNPVSVTVDAYPGRIWSGTVDSIAPASGSEFSILPAQNSSGNWVKVVQRITIRVRLEHKSDDLPLRAGMSVEANVDTGHIRSIHDLL